VNLEPRALLPLESFFVHLESGGAPMHMATVCLFDGDHLRDGRGQIRLGDLRAAIEARLPLVPNLRRRLQHAMVAGAPSVWVDDEGFDIANHVKGARVRRPGGERELLDRASQLLAPPLDRRHPLWRVWVFDGLADGRVAMLVQLHHAMADGLAGVAVATVLFDLATDAPPPPPPPPWHPVPAPSGPLGAAVDLARLALAPIKAASAALDALRHPQATARRAATLADALSTVLTPGLIAPRSSLNAPIGPRRRLAVVRQPIEVLHRVSARFETTVNDVLLAAVAGGLGELLASRGEEVAGRHLQAIVPVDLSHRDAHTAGNKVSALFVRLPLGVDDPVERLRRVAAEVRREKAHHQKLVAVAFFELVSPLPQPVLAAAATVVRRQRLANLFVTNVPGPPIPLYVLGDRLAEVFPVMPIAGNLSVSVAALSYAGQLSLGLLADPAITPDVGVLAEGVRRGFAELVAAADSATETASA
jgi:WS/DGAT/MGAT family acyltransferase